MGIRHDDVHTSIRTSSAGSVGRVWKLRSRTETATEMSEPGGLARIHSGDRSQRRAARTAGIGPFLHAPSGLCARLPVTAVRDPTDGCE